MKYVIVTVLILFILACNTSDDNSAVTPPQTSEELYFPPLNTDEWTDVAPSQLNWNEQALNELLVYLQNNNTRAFIILKDGKIVVEQYFGNTILGTSLFNKNSQWYWASAGKTITASLVGIAQEDGLLNINNSTSDYLGIGWTNTPPEKEQLITVKNQLTMTTGINYNVSDLNCTLPSCLDYEVDAGQQWYYHNATYTLLESVVENATGISYNDYTDQKIGSKIGMNGQWISQGYNNVYWSTTRDMARFGLMILNEGQWETTQVISDMTYFNEMINTSQNLNPSYGYLWWLNGKNTIIPPSFSNPLNVSLADNAPSDLFAGMGLNGQFVEVVPSQNLVVVRMGESPDASQVPIAFHNEMWEKINSVINP